MNRAEQKRLIQDIRHNCDISDARDHGIYSMCSMVLKLRNLYKWEKGLAVWDEPEPADLLDWIDGRETYWQTIAANSYRPLTLANTNCSVHDLESVNRALAASNLFYGAGHGRSMKAVFFLAEIVSERTVEGCPVVILGREWAREMASPFAMVQDGLIVLRKDSLRYFLWDHFQELRSSCRSSIRYVLSAYGLLKNGNLDQQRFRDVLDTMVAEQMDLFIYHEVGELLQQPFDGKALQALVGRFPGSVIEFVSRAVKDILADTHPQGLLAHLIREQRDTSLGLYVAFLDGLRQQIFPEMASAWEQFPQGRDWSEIERVRSVCFRNTLAVAAKISEIAQMIDDGTSDDEVVERFNSGILRPMGLEQPAAR